MAKKATNFNDIEQCILLKLEKCTDDFEKAHLMRLDVLVSYGAHSGLKINSASIIEEHLENYIPLVCNTSKINNYADLLKKELKNSSHKIKKRITKWEITKIDDISDLLTELNVKNSKYEDSNKTKNIPNDQFDKLQLVCHKFEDLDETNKSRNHEEDMVVHHPINDFQNNMKSENRNTTRGRQEIPQRNEVQVDKSNEFFQTASTEYHIQNLQKNAGNSMPGSSFEYGTSKKSLGLGGRRNVRSKFVPPIKRTLEELEEFSDSFTYRDGGNSSEEIDSRLKNIDRNLVEMIKNEIMRTVTQTNWDDIVGLEYTKSVIQEAIVWPLLRPDIFTGLRRPPKGVLLFGPPGTGKTMIGKCIASQSKSTFFSISASSLTSKWVGEGEKMVRALFAVAAVYQPSVVFIDEIDSLLCQRSENEHESSRRIKTEFLVQLDGAATSDDEKILIVGATNRPQELDEAARRRLVRRLYVPLPEYEARCKMLKNLLSSIKHELNHVDIKHISELTDGYSGADIKTLCTEASLEPIRSIPANLIPVFDKDNVRPVIFTDFEMALTRVRSSVSPDDLKQYIEWNKIYGSGSVSK